MLQWYRQLIALRRKEFDLMDSREETLRLDYDEEGRWLRMRRGQLQTFVNFSGASFVFRLGGFAYEIVLSSTENMLLESDRLTVPAEGVVLLRDLEANEAQADASDSRKLAAAID